MAKLDVAANPSTAQQYRVVSIPTLIVFQDGEPVARVVGARGKSALSELTTTISEPVRRSARPELNTSPDHRRCNPQPDFTRTATLRNRAGLSHG